jgi:hypothetical protein
MTQANFVNGAGGNINPSTFVVQDTTNNKAVNQAADATHFIVGVSQEYSKYAPIPSASTVAADTLGDPVLVYQDTDTCFLTSTTAGWTAGDRLTSNANGLGVTASSTNYYGAIALTTLSGVGLGQVKVVTGKNP